MPPLSRALRRVARWLRAGPNRLLLFTGLALGAALPMLRTAGAFNEFRDAQVLWLYEDQARRSVVDFFQVPLWNPDFCGGFPALGTPQSRFAAPTFLLTLLLGTTRAEPVTLFFMVLLALLGAHRYARSSGASHFGATLGAALFGLAGVFACAPFLGWFGFLGFALMPWALSGLRAVLQGAPWREGTVVLALSTAFIVGFGGTYVAPITLVAAAVELALHLARRRRVDLVTLATAGLLTLAATAFRLWPVWEELQRGPRLISGLSDVGLAVGGHLFGPFPPLSAETWYLVTVPGAVLSGLALLRRRGWWLLPPFLVFLWLATGHASTPSLFAALRTLPVFSLLRSAERFLVPAVLTLSVGAAFALDDVRARLRRRPTRRSRALAALALACLGVAVAWQLENFAIAAGKRSLTAPPRELSRPFHQARGNRWAAASWGPMSRGSLACWEAYGLPEAAALRGDLAHEAWLAAPEAGVLKERGWSPNRLDFTATLQAPTHLRINQNFHRGWRSSVGEVVSDDGLLSVALPAGTHEVTLRFLPTSVLGGATCSALGLLALLLGLRAVQGRGARLALACVPLAAGGLLALLRPEPAFTTNVPTGPEGEPLLVAAVPADATPLGARFEGGFTLAAASVRYDEARARVRVELDWSREAKVNSRLGVFAHLEPGTTQRITGDHLQLSDALLLEQLPEGQLGRDVLLVDVPEDRRGQTWNVWVGLWEMRGDGHRMRVLDAHGQQVNADRVLAGSVEVPKAGP